MATCRKVYLYALWNIFVKSSAEIVIRDICLKKVFSFANNYDYARPTCKYFSESEARTFFERGTTPCNTTCKISMDFNNQNWIQLGLVSMVFEHYNYSGSTGCSTTYATQLIIDCSNLKKEQLGIFFYSNCKKTNADCSNLDYLCVCHCDPGYFMYFGHCILGDIVVGDTCKSDLQCTGSEHAGICHGGVCSCQNGYFRLNNSCYLKNVLEAGKCVLDTQCRENENIQSNHRCVNGRCVCKEGFALINHTCHEGLHGLNEAKTENLESPRENITAILGALCGGLLLGGIITIGTVYFVYRRFRYSIDKRSRKEPGVMYAVNDTFDDVRDEDTFQNKAVTNKSKDNQKKVLNVSPLTRPQELPEYSNASRKEPAMTTMDDVYNHLNEKGETQDDETYDHACAAAARSHLKDLDDYSNIHAMVDGTTVSDGTENDDYSTLEHN